MGRRPRSSGAILVLAGLVAACAGAVGLPAPTSAPGSPAGSAPAAIASPATSPRSSPPSLPEPSARPPVGAIATERLDGVLQRALDGWRQRQAVPGVSVTIIFGDGSTWTGTSGLADVAARRRVTPTTAFPLASISKTFLAALVLDLIAEGRLALNDSAASYLPGRAIDPAITIRQLLDHTSGLHDFYFNPKIDRALRSEPARAWTAVESLGYVGKPYFPPGTGWHYSNTNYLLLGLIAERMGQAPLAEQLRSRFLDPLRLSTAFYQDVEEPRGALVHGYRFTGSRRTLPPIDLTGRTGVAPFRSVVTAAGGAGSLAAGSADVARWARALYAGDAIDVASRGLMLGGVQAVAGYHPSVPYGLGVQALRIDRFATLGHSGRFLGARAAMRYLPEEGVSIAVLTNQNRADPAVLVRDLLRIALPLPGPCGSCPDAS